MIYLGTFVMTAGLTLFMAHTAVAAAVFPLLTAIHALYGEQGVNRFGKGLFIGMAFTAGAGSIITLFGAARAAVAKQHAWGCGSFPCMGHQAGLFINDRLCKHRSWTSPTLPYLMRCCY